MKSRILFSVLFVIISIIPHKTSFANSAEDVTGPQLSFNPPPFIVPLSLEIGISPSKVTMKYLIKNISDQDSVERLHFYLSEHRWNAHMDWHPDRRFKDLKVMVNGEEIGYKSESRAYLGGSDITRRLKELEFDPDWVHSEGDEGIEIKNQKNNISKFERLQNDEGLIKELRSSSEGESVYFAPNWSTTNHYYWDQEFPKNDIVEIFYSYKPMFGFIVEYFGKAEGGFKNWLEDTLNMACLNQSDIKKMIPSDLQEMHSMTIDLSKISWKRNMDNFKLAADFSGAEPENDWDVFPQMQKGIAAAFCINGKGYFGEPKFVIDLHNVNFEKEIIFLLFAKNPEPAG